jgi:hypothetical protein
MRHAAIAAGLKICPRSRNVSHSSQTARRVFILFGQCPERSLRICEFGLCQNAFPCSCQSGQWHVFGSWLWRWNGTHVGHQMDVQRNVSQLSFLHITWCLLSFRSFSRLDLRHSSYTNILNRFINGALFNISSVYEYCTETLRESRCGTPDDIDMGLRRSNGRLYYNIDLDIIILFGLRSRLRSPGERTLILSLTTVAGLEFDDL